MAIQITNQADYATRAMYWLAVSNNSHYIPSSEVAEKMHISQMFLSRINSLLCLAGLINTQRGSKGGITLARKPADISLYDIITAVDGPIMLRRNLSETNHGEVWEFKPIWGEINGALVNKLKSISLQDLVETCPPTN